MAVTQDRIRPQVYLITPPVFSLDIMEEALKDAFSGGEIAVVQLRMKSTTDRDIIAAARTLMPIAHAHDAAFLINDRADLAKETGADGVHLGQEDGTVPEARNLLGYDRDIGVTCHNSRHLAFLAGEAGADYVAFGAFYPTGTKDPRTMADIETLELWSAIAEIPSVAIGGIKADNCAPLIKAGADFLAVCSYVWSHEDGPAHAIKALHDAIDKAWNQE